MTDIDCNFSRRPNEAAPAGYVVTGFYTPDYEPLALKFMANLDAHGAPHKLYPTPQRAWENAILLKPTIVEQAMLDHPDKAVILMDIDCVLSDSIAPMAASPGDVALFMGVQFRNYGNRSRQMRVVSSSRVIVFQPTKPARDLAANWLLQCAAQETTSPKRDDEEMLMRAIGLTEGLSLGIIDKRYSGRDPIDAPEDAVVVHYSAHDATRIAAASRQYLKRARRRIIGWIVGKPYKEWKYGEFGEF